MKKEGRTYFRSHQKYEWHSHILVSNMGMCSDIEGIFDPIISGQIKSNQFINFLSRYLQWLYTLNTAEILSDKNARTWVSMVLRTFKKINENQNTKTKKILGAK